MDIIFFCASSTLAKQYCPKYLENNQNCFIIDNSSHYRLDSNVDIIIPPINKLLLKTGKRIISNSNCTTSGLIMAIYKLHKFGLKNIIISSFQSVSGSGYNGLNQLLRERLDEDETNPIYPHHIHNNIIPLIGKLNKEGITSEEEKLINETKKIFKALTKKRFPKARYCKLINLYDIQNSSVIDKAIVVWFPAPKTYTGENILEINIHGGNSVLEHLIENLLLIRNVREAEPGEFTRRAFTNNKMDFLEAEGVMDLINAETKSQKSLAMQQVNGSLSTIFKKWNNKLLKLLAHYEGQIDFPEDEVPKNTEKKVISQVIDLIKEINFFLSDKKRGDIIRSGVEIAIVGRPNVGKSSLVNQIAKKDIAIVSKTSGTTRDVIEIKINLSNIPVILSDTAGLKDSPRNNIEKQGVLRSKRIIKNCNIKLLVMDVSCNFEKKILKLVCNKTIIILNKKDLLSKKKIDSKINYLKEKNFKRISVISAKKGTGINNLLNDLENYIKDRYKNVFFGEPVLTRTRHRAALKKCLSNLKKINNNKDPELNAEDLRLSLNAIGNVTGKYEIEKMLDIVFKDFCIGK